MDGRFSFDRSIIYLEPGIPDQRFSSTIGFSFVFSGIYRTVLDEIRVRAVYDNGNGPPPISKYVRPRRRIQNVRAFGITVNVPSGRRRSYYYYVLSLRNERSKPSYRILRISIFSSDNFQTRIRRMLRRREMMKSENVKIRQPAK